MTATATIIDTPESEKVSNEVIETHCANCNRKHVNHNIENKSNEVEERYQENENGHANERYYENTIDVLQFLGICSNFTLMVIVFTMRAIAILLMYFAHRILPLLFSLDSLVFDTCQELYDDTRFAFLRNWDAVHFYHIAEHGYSHDNVCAFFPLVPSIIKIVTFITSERCLPILRVLAPVSLYVTLINVVASCFGAIILRNLTRMTFQEHVNEEEHEANNVTTEQIKKESTEPQRTKIVNDEEINEIKDGEDDDNDSTGVRSTSIRKHNDNSPNVITGTIDGKQFPRERYSSNNYSSSSDNNKAESKNTTCNKSESHTMTLTFEEEREQPREEELEEEHEEREREKECHEEMYTETEIIQEELHKYGIWLNLHKPCYKHLKNLSLQEGETNNHIHTNNDVNNDGRNSNSCGHNSNRLMECREQIYSNGEKGAPLDRFAAIIFAFVESATWRNYFVNMKTQNKAKIRSNKFESEQNEHIAHEASYLRKVSNAVEETKELEEEKWMYVCARTGERIVGGALLMWIASPATIFTVVNYTESLFGLFTMCGIYLMNLAPPLIREGMLPETTNNITKRTSHAEPGTNSILSILTIKLRSLAMYICALSSIHELFATLCFVIACSIRSNAILCGGFLLYPIFLSLFFPHEYARRYQLQRFTSPQRKNTSLSSSESESSSIVARPQISVYNLPVVFLLCRIMVVIMECICITLPYLLLNYHCWHRFAHTWSVEEQAKMSHGKFFRFYSLLQHRYWNVGFLTSYTIANLPNVLLALPIMFCVFRALQLYYIRPIRKLWLHKESTQKLVKELRKMYCAIANRMTLQSNFTNSSKLDKDKSVELKNSISTIRHSINKMWESLKIVQELIKLVCCCLYDLIGLLTESCNVVYLCALTFIALTMMHIQVSTRFLSSCPALYWLAGLQLALHPTNFGSRLLIAYWVIYALVGAVLFANHMPWT